MRKFLGQLVKKEKREDFIIIWSKLYEEAWNYGLIKEKGLLDEKKNINNSSFSRMFGN